MEIGALSCNFSPFTFAGISQRIAVRKIYLNAI